MLTLQNFTVLKHGGYEALSSAAAADGRIVVSSDAKKSARLHFLHSAAMERAYNYSRRYSNRTITTCEREGDHALYNDWETY